MDSKPVPVHGLTTAGILLADTEIIPLTDEDIPTFFSKMNHKFVEVEMDHNQYIPVQPFLDAVKSIIPIFDILGPTLFSPVINDLQGNVRKIETKHKEDPLKLATLQQIILHEKETADIPKDIDATDALLWLKRGLEFIKVFFKELLNGSQDLSTSAYNAYSQTLKAYHGWIIRGVFSMIVRAIPNRETFLKALAPTLEKDNKSACEKQIGVDGTSEMNALDNLINIINDFYKEQGVDSSNIA